MNINIIIIIFVMNSEDINFIFNKQLLDKSNELEQLISLKKVKKMNSVSSEINFSVKNTISKINAEKERKIKNSKAYKKEQQYNS